MMPFPETKPAALKPHFSHLGLLTSVTVAVLCVVGCSSADNLDQPRADVRTNLNSVTKSDSLPKAYTEMARLLSDGPFLSKKLPAESLDSASVRARVQNTLLQLNKIAPPDEELRFIRDESVAAVEEMMGLTDELAKLPAAPDAIDQIGATIMLTALGRTDVVVDNDLAIARQNEFIETSLKKLAASDRRLKAATLMLRECAAKHAPPQLDQAQLIDIDVDEAWPTAEYAWLTLVNSSGKEIHDCTICVQLVGPDGKFLPHLHFIPVWRPGQPLFLHYDRGAQLGDITLGAGLPSRIDQVLIDLFASEFHQEQITFKYSQTERDLDIERYCGDLDFTARFQDFKSGFFKSDLPAIMCKFTGTTRLPAGNITVKRSNGSTKTLAFQQWLENDEVEIQFRDLERLPTNWELQVRFTGSNVVVQRSYGK